MSLKDLFPANQMDLIPEYQEKWRRVYLDTQPINPTKATAAVQQAYRVMSKPEPEVVFCPSPRAALDRLQSHISPVDESLPSVSLANDTQKYRNSFLLYANIAGMMFKSVSKEQKVKLNAIFKLIEDLENSQLTSLEKRISTALPKKLTSQEIIEYNKSAWDFAIGKIAEHERSSSDQEKDSFSAMFEQKIPWFPGKRSVSTYILKKMIASSIVMNMKIDESTLYSDTTEFYNSISAAEVAFLSENPPINTWHSTASCAWIDFATSAMSFSYDHEKWQALKELTEQCGWIFAMDDFCIVCDRVVLV
jgi:hypothetical protein